MDLHSLRVFQLPLCSIMEFHTQLPFGVYVFELEQEALHRSEELVALYIL